MTPLPPHMYIRPLGPADLDQILKLESRTLVPCERAGRDRNAYRLRVAPELSAGMFVRVPAKGRQCNATVLNPAVRRDVSSDSSYSSEKLIGFIIAVKSDHEYMTDDAICVPEIDGHGKRKQGHENLGHVEYGRTIVVESLMVDPDYKGMKIGTIILRDFIQRMASQSVAQRVSLLARPGAVKFYENLGFYDGGASNVKFAGGGWQNVCLDLDSSDE
ncbi:hypothetical protein V1514DRAFT_274472 [Lipomyces japonicus]|uniref:uncharacterized protein n=1 Tax=Lipomyces japonicus TaxID=56871 RepID=UPI0034CD08D0